MNQDFRDMLRLLEEHGVDYLVVGGYAVIRGISSSLRFEV
jgi:hypothetical protein